jgi:hypothetical protein
MAPFRVRFSMPEKLLSAWTGLQARIIEDEIDGEERHAR